MQLKTFCPFPVGYVYLSADGTSPGTLFPNTSWERIQDVFLLASGNRTAGDTGGSEDVTLTTDQIPSHSHSVGAHAHGLNSHTHSVGAHKHQVPAHGHTYTRPTVSSSGAITNGITGGSHSHRYKGWADVTDGSGPYRVPGAAGSDESYTTKEATHTHNLPNHTHTLTGGGVANKAAFDTNNSAAFNSGTPSTANTANSAAFDSGAAGGGRLTATCRRTSRSTCGRGSRRARRRSALPSREVA